MFDKGRKMTEKLHELSLATGRESNGVCIDLFTTANKHSFYNSYTNFPSRTQQLKGQLCLFSYNGFKSALISSGPLPFFAWVNLHLREHVFY